MGKVTIKDVAKAASVSVATVSYVINRTPHHITTETRERVMSAMHHLGYSPNASARRLRRSHNNILGLAIAGLAGVPGVTDLYFLDIVRGVGVAADARGYDLMLFSNVQKLKSETFFRELSAQHMIDGLIATGSLLSLEGVAYLGQNKIPSVLIGRQPTLPNSTPCVTYAYEEDAFRLTEALIQMGHQRLGLFLNTVALRGVTERVAGYQRALAAHHLPDIAELVHISDEIEIHPKRAVVERMVQQAQPTALIIERHVELCEFLDQLDPQNTISVATLDEDPLLPHPARLVAGIRLPKYEAGVAAVEALLPAIKSTAAIPRETILPSQLKRYPQD